jgi:hypothetical protein
MRTVEKGSISRPGNKAATTPKSTLSVTLGFLLFKHPPIQFHAIKKRQKASTTN